MIGGIWQRRRDFLREKGMPEAFQEDGFVFIRL
jgi:hypothetical protein